MFLEIKISDGLGNQLFQYAAGRSLYIRSRQSFLLLNTDSFKTNSVRRQFGLNNFNIKGKVIEGELFHKILRKNTRYNGVFASMPGYRMIAEDGLRIQKLPHRLGIFNSMSGFWQSEYYFKDIRPVLLRELVPVSVPEFPGWLKAENTVAVHIRRADYLKESGFGVLNEQYYRDAMSVIRQKVGSPVFVFFSDDIGWCKEQFKDESFVFCQEENWGKDYLQLYLLSKCRHQIIANSSFSWWGAWLNNYQEKIVIRPERPFADETLMYESYYPADWIPVNNYATR